MNQPTPNAYGNSLTPFRAIAADANFAAITPIGFGATGPVFAVAFGEMTPAKPGTPAIPQKSGPNLPDYFPAVPETPATPEKFTPHRTETLTLTQDEWDNWDKAQTDAAYILAIVAKRYGVTPK